MPRTELIVMRPQPHGLVARVRDAVRSYWSGPITSKSPELAKYFGGYGPTQSGVSVTEDSAMTASPVWSAVTMISDDIASLPLHLYKRTSLGKERYEAHPLYRLLHDAPNPEMDSMVMRRVMQTHALLWQNAYAEIERDQVGRPVAIWPLCPEYVTPFRDANGVLKYRYQANGDPVNFDAADMLHLVGHGHDGTVGCSMVQKARESIGMVLAAEKFGASFFGNGATFGGVISYKGPKPPELSDKNYKDTLDARHAGVQRAYRILALYNDAEFESVGVSPNEGQFNETRVFQIREVARWFKMPPHKLGDLADATYSNVEQMDAAYMSSCIRPWLVLWQQQLSRKLISPLERTQQFIEHDTHGFLSVDAAGRSALYKAEFDVGSVTPNDIRGYENRNRLEGGDDAFVQLNLVPLSRVGKWWDLLIEEKQANIEKLKQPPPPPPAPPPDANAQQKDQQIASQARKIEELTSARDLLKSALDTEKAERVMAATAYAANCDALERIIEQRDAAIAELKMAVTTVEQARDVALADVAAWDRKAGELADKVGAANADVLARDARIVTVEAEREEARAALSHLQELLDGANAALAGEQAERARELAERNAAIVERDDAIGARIMAETQAAAATARAEVAVTERDAAVQAQATAATAAETIRAREAKRLTDVITAHRGLMVDTMARMVRRESEKAKRNQATPQKLRAWAETFYPEHIETVAEAILPIVRLHLAWMQSDADPLAEARKIAESHVATSVQQIDAASQIEDFQPVLAKVLERMEVKRPEELADALVAEGIAYVRSYQ